MAIEPTYAGMLIGAALGLLTARCFNNAHLLIILWSVAGSALVAILCLADSVSLFSASLTGVVMGGVALLINVDHLRNSARHEETRFSDVSR